MCEREKVCADLEGTFSCVKRVVVSVTIVKILYLQGGQNSGFLFEIP
jgi:hypothetical protein